MQHKWNRQHKYLVASVDVKNPQANFHELENNVPPEETNDELLDQAWDVHTGSLWTRRRSRKPGSMRWSITTKCTCSMKSAYCSMLGGDRQGALESKMGGQTVQRIKWFAATPPIEALRAPISHTMSGPTQKALMGVRRLSSLLLRSSATRDTRGAV